ncbi:MAG TPA: sigma-E factor regulatory protein RseB domain-containing protein, partial [Gammaproteobacteria bacterium]
MAGRQMFRIGAGVAASFAMLPAFAQDAQDWLLRMSMAVEELSYQGTFLHMQGDDAETLQIVHLNDNGSVSERILALDGVAREIIRREDEVQCILPDRKAVLLEEKRDVSPLVSALPSYSDELL